MRVASMRREGPVQRQAVTENWNMRSRHGKEGMTSMKDEWISRIINCHKKRETITDTPKTCRECPFYQPDYQGISTEAKLLYGMMLDRMELSVANGWVDGQNRVFIYFTIEDVEEELQCASQKAVKLLTELEKGAGLIERKRQGKGNPSRRRTIKIRKNIFTAS